MPRTHLPSANDLREEARLLRRAADTVWESSERLLMEATDLNRRAAELEDLAEQHEEVHAAREWLGPGVEMETAQDGRA